MRKIAVIGSRHFTDYDRLERVLQPWLPAHIISGGAKGADALAEQLAREHELPITVIKPDWKQYGRGAGPIRKDRKSTRLNSSHVRISYAVFCLKKKTKKNIMQ